VPKHTPAERRKGALRKKKAINIGASLIASGTGKAQLERLSTQTLEAALKKVKVSGDPLGLRIAGVLAERKS